MAFMQILWSQLETRLMPNPLTQFPSDAERLFVARRKTLFSREVNEGGAGCASCHHNGNRLVDGVVDDTFQDYNIRERASSRRQRSITKARLGAFTNDYFFTPFGPPQDEGGQNISSHNTKHLRAFRDSVPNWLHDGGAHTIREILLGPDSPLFRPGERGFTSARCVRITAAACRRTAWAPTARVCRPKCRSRLPTAATMARARSSRGDGKGPLYVSLDSPDVRVTGPSVAYPEGAAPDRSTRHQERRAAHR